MKKITRILAFVFPIAIVAAEGCKKPELPQPDSHEYYQPVQIGNWYRYTVDSTFWNHADDTTATIQYTIYESFDTDVPNASGQLETRIKLERVDSLPRRVVGFSYVQRFYNNSKQSYSIERVDDGVRYVLFKAPINVPDTFNRNEKNLQLPDVWKNGAVGIAGGGVGENYDYTMRLVKKEYSDSIWIINDYELYAFNVGLFYKERTYIMGRTDTANWQNIPIMSRIDTGFSYKKVLVERGEIQ